MDIHEAETQRWLVKGAKLKLKYEAERERQQNLLLSLELLGSKSGPLALTGQLNKALVKSRKMRFI